MIGERLPQEQTTAIVATAQRYRDAIRRYRATQAMALTDRATLDDLVTATWTSFQEAMHVEEDLFTMLDALDEPRTLDETITRVQHRLAQLRTLTPEHLRTCAKDLRVLSNIAEGLAHRAEDRCTADGT